MPRSSPSSGDFSAASSLALGWATVLLFGRVPQSKQLLLTGIAFGSLGWVIVALGVLLPDVGTFLLAAVPVPGFIQPNWIRFAMLLAAIILPILIGIGGLFMLDAADRPAGGALVKQVLRGYPYAAVLAFSLLFMAVIAPLRKVRSIAKRWADAHIGVVIKPGGYERVAADLEHALDQPAWASAGAVLRASLRPRQSCSARLRDPGSSALSRTTSLPSNSCRIVLRRTPLSSPRRRSTRAALTCPPDHPTKLIRSAVRLSILSMTLGPDFPAPNDLERRSSRWGTMSA